MPRRKQSPPRHPLSQLLRRLWSVLAGLPSRLRLALRRWRQPIAIEVLVSDPARRRSLDRQLRAIVRRLDRLVPLPDQAATAVVVQQVIHSDHSLVGAIEAVQGTGGHRLNLIRLPLQVNGTRLTTDELFAALAEQWVYLVAPDTQRVGIRAMPEGEPRPAAVTPRPLAFRPDPLAAQGSAQEERPAPKAA